MKEEYCWGGDEKSKPGSKGGQVSFFQVFALVIGFGITFSACDKVTEKPEPDQFAQNELLNISAVADSNGEASVDILASNNLKEALSATFSNPQHGTLTAESSGSLFRYKAERGYTGEDSFTYKLCRTGGLCKSAAIKVKVVQKPIPCVPKFAPVGDYRDTVLASQYMSVKLHPGDVFCPESQLAAISNSWVIPWTLNYSGIQFGLGPVIRKDTEVRFIYQVCDKDYKNCSEVRTCSTLVKINDAYCDGIFRVNDFLYAWNVKKNRPYKFDMWQAMPNAFACEHTLDSSYFRVYASPTEAIVTPSAIPNQYIISPPDSSSKYARVHYEFRNKRGVIDSGIGRFNFVNK